MRDKITEEKNLLKSKKKYDENNNIIHKRYIEATKGLYDDYWHMIRTMMNDAREQERQKTVEEIIKDIDELIDYIDINFIGDIKDSDMIKIKVEKIKKKYGVK